MKVLVGPSVFIRVHLWLPMAHSSPGLFSLLTPPGEGGIAVFAVEGPGARAALARAVSSRRILGLEPGELAYGRLLDAGGGVLDEVIVAALSPREASSGPAIHSPQPATVIERFELNSHAGGAAAAAVAGRLRELGLEERSAPPEEPDLSGPEAQFRRMLPEVRTRRQLEALCQWRAENGRLEAEGRRTRTPTPVPAVMKTHRVVIAGPVNAGKSTLLNRLAGEDRAIVSPHPGTTRDSVAAEVSVRGLAVELVDTAGFGRLPGDALAAEAQEQAWREISGADLVLVVLDASAPQDAGGFAPELLRRARRAIIVRNKSDLAAAGKASGARCQASADTPQPTSAPDAPLAPTIAVSALTGAGIEELAAEMERQLLAG